VAVELLHFLQGPLEWSNGLTSDSKGQFLVTHDEINFEVSHLINRSNKIFNPKIFSTAFYLGP